MMKALGEKAEQTSEKSEKISEDLKKKSLTSVIYYCVILYYTIVYLHN